MQIKLSYAHALKNDVMFRTCLMLGRVIFPAPSHSPNSSLTSLPLLSHFLSPSFTSLPLLSIPEIELVGLGSSKFPHQDLERSPGRKRILTHFGSHNASRGNIFSRLCPTQMTVCVWLICLVKTNPNISGGG